MKFFWSLFSICISLSAYGQVVDLKLEPFTKLDVGGNFNIEIIEGDHQAHILLEDCTIEDLIIEVNAGTLSIEFSKSQNYSKNKKATITLETQKLKAVSTSASAYVHSTHIWESSTLSVDASSGSKVELSTKAKSTEVEGSSGSHITLTGQTEELDIDMSSGSKLKAKELSAGAVEVDASSGAKIEIDPKEKLKVDASSGSSVKYIKRPYGAKLSKSSGASVGKI